MPNLIIMHDQTGATGKDIIPLPDGCTPTDALMANFPQGLNPGAVQVFVGLKRMTLPSEGGEPSIELLQPIKRNMVVVMEAKAIGAIAGISAWWFVAAAVVAVAAVVYLTPDMPGGVGQQKNSPNNTLQGQTNIARPYQAYPLIFGSPVSYPDLTGEAVVEYSGNQKLVRQLMVVGIGNFAIAETRAGATPLTNFSGAVATYYEPASGVVTVPEVVNVFSTNEIDGQELLGTGSPIIIENYNLTESGTGDTTFIGTTFVFKVVKDVDSDALLADYVASTGGAFFLLVSYRANTTGFGGDEDLRGVGDIESMVLDAGSLFYTITLLRFNGKRPVAGSISYNVPFACEQVENSIIGPVKIAVPTDEVWINFTFLRGLKSTVSIEIEIYPLDGPNGDPIMGPQQNVLFFVDYEADTLDQQFRTFKQVLVNGFGYYQVSLRRLDIGTNDAEKPDQTTVEAVYAVSRQTNVEYGDLTMVDVTMPATINATSLRENKINIDVASKLITYENGVINYTPQASRKMADAILHMYVIFFNRDPETLALDELYEIQNRLDAIDPRLATFDFTFDDMDVSLDERMDSILQVARCYKWLDGDVYRFGRNDSRAFEATTVTRRDISATDDRDYSLSYNPQLLENFDSVKVQYVDKAINKNAYIFRKIDDLGNIIEGAGANPKSLELAGCSESYNAINRAELEIRTLLYQRFSLTDTLEPSAMFLDRGDMILYAEQYNSDVFDGEILAVNGSIATVSESLVFEAGKDYTINYTTPNGSSVGPFDVFEVAGEPFKFQCDSLLSVFLRDSQLGFSTQTGSRYIISTTEELDAAKWSILEKEARGRSVQLTMVNYDDRIFEFDGV